MKFVFSLLLVLSALVTVNCINAEKCKGKRQAFCDRLIEVKDELAECKEENKKLSDEIKDLKKKNDELSDENKKLKSDLSDCQKRNEDLEKKIAELEEEIEELKKNPPTSPPATNPPATNPPATNPPETSPPATSPPEPKNCAEVLRAGKTTSGVYSIDPDGQGAFDVFCDQNTQGGGYVLIQRRKDGSENFYRGWDDYKNGFGDLGGEFWLGLDKIHRLTSQTTNELRVGLIDWSGNSAQALYTGFTVAGEDDSYRMNYAGFGGGTAGNSLCVHKGMQFTTLDRDHDKRPAWNCAEKYKGGWWYNQCHQANLNGLYMQGGTHSEFAVGINWKTWKGYYYSAMKSAMRIRPM